MQKVIKELVGGVVMALVCFATIILLLMCSAHEVRAETWTSIGTYTITHYCPCARCCGRANQPTASGVMPQRYRTVAVDPKEIPFGTVLYIEGYGYRVAEDAGVSAGKIDVFTTDHQHAWYLGVKRREVWIVED